MNAQKKHSILVSLVFSGMVLTAVTNQAAMTLELGLAADSLALTDGAAVSSWTDTSGFARHATQLAAAYQPTFQTNELNGLPVVRFAATFNVDDMDALVVDYGTAVSQPMTVFTVAKVAGNKSATPTLSSDVFFDGFQDAGASRVAAAINGAGGVYNWAGAGAGYPTGGTSDDWLNQWLIYEFYFNGASSELFFDGTSKATGNVGPNTITAAGDLIIGTLFNYNWSGLNGDMAEFQLYSGAPTLEERTAAGYALAEKYNLPAYGFVPIPEPATALLLVGGGLLALRRRR